MCWAGAVLNALLSRNTGEEINQPLIYLGGQILLPNWFLIWTQFPSGCSDVSEISDLCKSESNRIFLLFRQQSCAL